MTVPGVGNEPGDSRIKDTNGWMVHRDHSSQGRKNVRMLLALILNLLFVKLGGSQPSP